MRRQADWFSQTLRASLANTPAASAFSPLLFHGAPVVFVPPPGANLPALHRFKVELRWLEPHPLSDTRYPLLEPLGEVRHHHEHYHHTGNLWAADKAAAELYAGTLVHHEIAHRAAAVCGGVVPSPGTVHSLFDLSVTTSGGTAARLTARRAYRSGTPGVVTTASKAPMGAYPVGRPVADALGVLNTAGNWSVCGDLHDAIRLMRSNWDNSKSNYPEKCTAAARHLYDLAPPPGVSPDDLVWPFKAFAPAQPASPAKRAPSGAANRHRKIANQRAAAEHWSNLYDADMQAKADADTLDKLRAVWTEWVVAFAARSTPANSQRLGDCIRTIGHLLGAASAAVRADARYGSAAFDVAGPATDKLLAARTLDAVGR